MHKSKVCNSKLFIWYLLTVIGIHMEGSAVAEVQSA